VYFQDDITFSDDDDLDFGLDDGPSQKKVEKSEPKSELASSLFGKSSVEKHLQRPGTGGSQKEFSIGTRFQAKPSTPSTPGMGHWFTIFSDRLDSRKRITIHCSHQAYFGFFELLSYHLQHA